MSKVLVILGSASDKEKMEPTWKTLKEFDVDFRVVVSSAHRTPERTRDIIREAEKEGVKVIIAGAGAAAHLPGVIAAETVLPVIGVPVDSSPLAGVDSLLSIVQMPPGIPVATVGVGKMGAKNAAYLAVSILALTDEDLRRKLIEKRREMAEKVISDSEKLEKELSQ